ncbi:MAG: hypothetical protein ABSC03_08280 [Verrucomicrobiota bacterium]|jgi:hypothetical protein
MNEQPAADESTSDQAAATDPPQKSAHSHQSGRESRSYLGRELLVAILAAVVTLVGSQWLQKREETLRQEAVVRVIYSTVQNDLQLTIGVVSGFRSAILKKNLSGDDPAMFRQIYHPWVGLPEFSEKGSVLDNGYFGKCEFWMALR